MKKTLTLSLIFAGTLVLLAPATTSARQQVASLAPRGNARTLKTKRAVAAAAEELRFSMSAWQKRKEALQKYLATVSPTSNDYQVTKRSLAEIDARMQDMARELVGMEFPSLPAPAAAREADPTATLSNAASAGAVAPQQELKADLVSNDGKVVSVSVDVTNYRRNTIKGEATDSKGDVVWSKNIPVGREDTVFTVPGIKLAASGDTTITMSSPDDTVSTSVTVTAAAAAAAATTKKSSGRRSGLVGLLVAGSVISQQAESISQADPFMGFVVGYDDADEVDNPKWRLHWRVQGIFQTQPKKEEAPVEGTGDGEPEPGTDEDAPADFKSFIASRKSFDVEMSAWIDRAARRFIFFGGGESDPNVRVGVYGAIGGTAYVDKNELKGDESVKVEDTDSDADADDTNDQVELDTERAKIDNDIDHFYEFGLIGNFFTGMGTENPRLFMQAKIGYGRYEALAGFNPSKDGFLNDSRNRFVGKLRVFPMFLDVNPEGTADSSPMFGVEINAGRGPDQIKFFTGIATAIKLFK